MNQERKHKKIIVVTLVVLLLVVILIAFAWKKSYKQTGKNDKKYTCEELHHMPEMELYQLFLAEGLTPMDELFANDTNMEEQAKAFKDHFDRSHLGIAVGSYTGYLTLANQTKEIFDRITVEPDISFEVLEKTENSTETGYLLKVKADRMSLSEFSASIQETREQLKHQFENGNSLSAAYAGSLEIEFDSYIDAKTFIGLKNVAEVIPVRDFEEKTAKINILGDENGDIHEIGINTDYQKDNIMIQTSVNIYTDQINEEIILQCIVSEELEYYEQYFCATGYHHCLSILSSKMESGRCMQDGYFVKDGILYQIHISYPENQLNDILGIVQEWADSILEQ